MSTAALLFVATFGVVFALGLQSLNVNGGHKLAAAVTSFAISGSNLVLFKLLPGPTGVLEIAAYLLGGPLGIVASMLAHPHLMAWAQRPPSTWRLQLVSPHEAEAQVAAAFACADTADEPFIERLQPSPAAAGLHATALNGFAGLHRSDPVTAALTSAEHQALRELADELLHPDGFAHAVPPEVRDRARIARGLQPCEIHSYAR